MPPMRPSPLAFFYEVAEELARRVVEDGKRSRKLRLLAQKYENI